MKFVVIFWMLQFHPGKAYETRHIIMDDWESCVKAMALHHGPSGCFRINGNPPYIDREIK